jgi:hypothetical protein
MTPRPAVLCALGLALGLGAACFGRPANCELRDGKMFIDGRWVFLKIAKPLLNYADAAAVDSFIPHLPVLKEKHYSVVEINCYWHHFDRTGDMADLPTAPLRKFIDAVDAAGMYPCLSVETYGVGGGHVPEWFWKRHGDAVAIDSRGREVKDDEYGVMSRVPSLFCREYLDAARRYIRALTAAVPHQKILWFETTVEPQFMGRHALDFSPHALREWAAWLEANGFGGPAVPSERPVPQAFLEDARWNRFRAEWLADWINGDAAAFREVAGKDAYVAVDYLETCNPADMRNRNGDSLTFLRRLGSPNIIQVNWHWHVASRRPNACAYENVKRVMNETGRRWAVSEHMTLNGTDYSPEAVPDLLRNTIRQGTGFGWEFVSVTPDDSPFSLYNPDWSPRPTMKIVDERWSAWLDEIRAAHEAR